MCELAEHAHILATQTDWSNVRGWIQIAIIIVAGYVAIQRLNLSQKQRKLENAYKMVDGYKELLETGVFNTYNEIKKSEKEINNTPNASYDFKLHSINYKLDALYSKVPPDDGDIENLTETIDMICYAISENTVDHKVIIYELWYELETIYNWLVSDNKKELVKRYPHLVYVYDKYKVEAAKLPKKSYFSSKS